MPQKMGRQGGPGEEPHQDWRSTGKGTPYPELSEPEREAVQRCLAPVADALKKEAPTRSDAAREDL